MSRKKKKYSRIYLEIWINADIAQLASAPVFQAGGCRIEPVASSIKLRKGLKMGNIFVTSDLHFNHDREFIFKPRGFENVCNMNETIISNWNNLVCMDDDVYVLGDIMLGNNDLGIKMLKQLKGKIHIICGNHDTDTRRELYKECYNVVEVLDATMIHYKGYHFFLSHYPCFTASLEKDNLKSCTCNLFGHTHQTTKFFEVDGKEHPYMYCCCLDAHNLTPVALDDVIEDVYRARCAWVNPSSDDEEVR